MKKLLFLLLLPLSVLGQGVPPPSASQAEVDAGLIKNKYVSPLTLTGFSLAQATNGISASQATNIVAQNNAATATLAAMATKVADGNTNRWAATNAAVPLSFSSAANKISGTFTGTLTNATTGYKASLKSTGSGELESTGGFLSTNTSSLANTFFGGTLSIRDPANLVSGPQWLLFDTVAVENLNFYWYDGAVQYSIFQLRPSGDVAAAGTITAPFFNGDGSALTGVRTNSIDDTFYRWVLSNSGGAAFPLSNDGNAAGHSITNLDSLEVSGSGGSDTNAIIAAGAGGELMLTNPVTHFAFGMHPNGHMYGNGADLTGVQHSATEFFTIIPTNATDADFQAALDIGGTLWFAGTSNTVYTWSTNHYVREATHIIGNNVQWDMSLVIETNFLLDTGTNFGKEFVMEDVRINGGVIDDYASYLFFTPEPLSIDPYYNNHWTNRSGIRIEASGGGQITRCTLYGFSGNGLAILNERGTSAHSFPRIIVTDNTFYSNFCSVYIIGRPWSVPAYFNAFGRPPSGYVSYETPAEYMMITKNYIFQSQYGIWDGAANVMISQNQITTSMIGVGIGDGPNSGGHGTVQGNQLNHNNYPIWGESAIGGLISDNVMLAQNYALDTPSVVFNACTKVQFQNNYLGVTTLTFTNGTTGTIINNDYLLTWGVDNVTNIDSGMVIYGNHNDSGGDDGYPYPVPALNSRAKVTATAFLVPTNSAPSHIVVVGESDFKTNAAFALTSVSGILGTAYSSGVLHVTNSAGGSTIAITAATPWHSTGTWNCTNETVISVTVIPGRSTNAISYPQW